MKATRCATALENGLQPVQVQQQMNNCLILIFFFLVGFLLGPRLTHNPHLTFGRVNNVVFFRLHSRPSLGRGESQVILLRFHPDQKYDGKYAESQTIFRAQGNG